MHLPELNEKDRKLSSHAEHRYARMLGYKRELELLQYLKKTYPYESLNFKKGTWKDTYDIYGRMGNFDMVGYDARYRLILGHKRFCRDHKEVQARTGIKGYIVFFWMNEYYFLPVSTKLLCRKKVPTITAKLLGRCVKHPDGYLETNYTPTLKVEDAIKELANYYRRHPERMPGWMAEDEYIQPPVGLPYKTGRKIIRKTPIYTPSLTSPSNMGQNG